MFAVSVSNRIVPVSVDVVAKPGSCKGRSCLVWEVEGGEPVNE